MTTRVLQKQKQQKQQTIKKEEEKTKLRGEQTKDKMPPMAPGPEPYPHGGSVILRFAFALQGNRVCGSVLLLFFGNSSGFARDIGSAVVCMCACVCVCAWFFVFDVVFLELFCTGHRVCSVLFGKLRCVYCVIAESCSRRWHAFWKTKEMVESDFAGFRTAKCGPPPNQPFCISLCARMCLHVCTYIWSYT